MNERHKEQLKLLPLYKFSKIGYSNMGAVKESALKCLINFFPKYIKYSKPSQIVCILKIHFSGIQTQWYLIKKIQGAFFDSTHITVSDL